MKKFYPLITFVTFSFAILLNSLTTRAQTCTPQGNQTSYGNNSTWRGYLYQGKNFDTYKGYITRGSTNNPNFDESWGGRDVSFTTNGCPVQTEIFSARFRLRATFTAATYIFTVGADDGYRLSLDGGATWVINKWVTQGYNVTSYTVNLSGTYNIVLEYFDDGGPNRLSYAVTSSTTMLPVTLTAFTAQATPNGQAQLNWTTTDAVNFNHYVVQSSTDGITFSNLQTIGAQAANSHLTQTYSYTDVGPAAGVTYYRLAMVDINGATSYSGIKTASFKTTVGVKLYPTIVENGLLYLESAQPIDHGKVQVIDMNGRVLQSAEGTFSTGRQPITLKQGQATGTYIVLVLDGTTVLAKKTIILQ